MHIHETPIPRNLKMQCVGVICGTMAATFLAGCTNNNTAHSVADDTPIITKDDYARAERFFSWRKDEYIKNDAVTPHWIGDGAAFWYKRAGVDGSKEFVRVITETGEKAPAFDQASVAAELTRLTGDEITADALPFDSFQYDEDSRISFQIADNSYVCGVDCEVKPTPKPAFEPDETVSPNGKWAIYFKDHNLWARALDGSEDFALTTDGEPDNTYGISTGSDLSPITRLRMGKVDAPLVMFSPDGNKLLVQHIDQRKVEVLHLLQHAPEDGSRRPKLYSYRYAFALDEHKPMGRFVVFDLDSRERVDVDYPAIALPHVPHTTAVKPDARWQADGTAFYFVHRYEFGKGYAINRVDAHTGAVVKLAERSAERTAFPAIAQSLGSVLQPVGDRGVIWWSDETGWGHLYYSTLDGDKRQLTDGAWNVNQLVRFDDETETVFFLHGQSEDQGNPYHTALASMSLNAGDMRTLADETGVHQITAQHFSPDGAVFIDNVSSTELPGVSYLRHADGKIIAEIERADISKLEATGLVPPESFTVTAADGQTRLWGKILKPTNFDPKKSYPVIDSIYPGPQIHRVGHSFSGGLTSGLFETYGEPQALAELGFIVVILDGRGTPGRSRSFHYDTEKSLIGDAGSLDDHVAAIQELAQTRPYMDLDRVGIYGHSGGGFASAKAILIYPDFFKVAVSSNGNHDQRVYLPAWGESYLGPEAGDNYSLASNPELASNLKGKLLITVGDLDDNVHPANSYQLIQALIEANKDFDQLSLPNGNHGFQSLKMIEALYFRRRRWDYFVEHLMGAEPPESYAITPPPSQATQ